MDIKITKIIDCLHDNCPMPLIKTREAIINSNKNDIIKIIGTHPQSYEEIPMALESMGLEVLKKSKNNINWEITFKVK